MIYEVSSVSEPKPWESSHGTMWGYDLLGKLDGEAQKASVNTKANGKAPFVGEAFECTVSTPDTGYGVRLKRAMGQAPAFQKHDLPQGTKANSVEPVPDRQYVPDDQRQSMIVRQSSLKAALEYCSIKIPLLDDEGKGKFDTDMVIAISEKFAQYALTGKNPSKQKESMAAVPDGVRIVEVETSFGATVLTDLGKAQNATGRPMEDGKRYTVTVKSGKIVAATSPRSAVDVLADGPGDITEEYLP